MNPMQQLDHEVLMKFFGYVESIDKDVYTIIIAEPPMEKIYGISQFSIYPKLARLERKVNNLINKIFQEKPALP